MPKAAPIQNNMNAGEVSPLLEGRVDLRPYVNGLKRCLNFVPLAQGPITRRPGTMYVAAPKYSNKACRLERFEYSTVQAYILEIGDLYMRFFRNEGRLESPPGTPVEIVTPYPEAEVFNVRGTQSADTLYLTHKSYAPRKLVRNSSTSWTLSTIVFQDGPYLPVNTTTTSLQLSGTSGSVTVTASSITGINGGTGFQTTDICRLIRGKDQANNWTWLTITARASTTSVTATISGANAVNPAVTITGATQANPCVITATNTLNNGDVVLITGVVGMTQLNGNYYTVQNRTGTTFELAGINSTGYTAYVSGGTAQYVARNWRLGVWSDTTGWPAVSTFFGDRLYFGGSTNYPDRIDGSTVSDYENMAPSNAAGTVADNNALSFTLNSNSVNAIYWLADNSQGLLVGTAAAEWLVSPSTLGEALTPTNVSAKLQTRYGSKFVAPILTGKTVLFLQRAGRKIREYLYNWEDNGFTAPDVSILSEHITVGGVKQMAYQSEPQSVGYMVRNDGTLLSLTYEKAQEVYGWARHVLGGDPAQTIFSRGAIVNPDYSKVESVACIPASAGTSDETWVLVSRKLGGSTVRSIEYITPFYIDEDDVGERFFVDMGAIYSGAPATTVSGLSWFPNGTVVTVLADGATHPNCTVTGGAITLNRSASVVHVGLGYNSDLWTQRINAGAANGTAQGKIKRIHKLVARFFQTLGLQYGPEEGKLDRYTFRRTSDPMGDAPPYLDDDTRDILWKGGYERTGRIYIRADQPLPMTLLALMPTEDTQD